MFFQRLIFILNYKYDDYINGTPQSYYIIIIFFSTLDKKRFNLFN